MRGMFLFVSLRPAGELYHQVAVTEFADFVRATGWLIVSIGLLRGCLMRLGMCRGLLG